MLQSIDPSTGLSLQEYPEADAEEIAAALEAANAAFQAWRRRPIADRAVLIVHAGTFLNQHTRSLADLMAEEMGKPVAQGRAELEKCALACYSLGDSAEAFLAPEPIETSATRSYVAFEPLGVVLGVMPWNFPFWQVVRFAVPALLAGNVCVLKHASNVSGCALAIQEILRIVGFPAGVFTTLLVGSHAVEGIIESPHVRAVSLTGSTPAGRAVAAAAGRALKKTVLELGGSDPYLILEDADLDVAVPACVAARLVNTGQSCIAGKRFIVVESVRAAFTERFVDAMRAKRFGDPKDETNDLGPMARVDLRDQLHSQVRTSVERGARLLCGGEIPPGRGAWYPATVLDDVRPGMPAYDEELFGPAAAILVARDEADAIRIANDTPFGLGAAVFTRDAARGERIAAEALEAGSCFVNAFVRSDPRLPFGGVKESGYGRELAALGIREFVNAKTVYVA